MSLLVLCPFKRFLRYTLSEGIVCCTFQDKEDDLKVGVKSTALRFGDLTKNWVTGFGIACISGLTLSGFNAELGMFGILSIADMGLW